MNNIPSELDQIILKKFSIIDLKGQGAYGTLILIKFYHILKKSNIKDI